MSHYIISSIIDSSLLDQKEKSPFIVISESIKHGSEFVILEKEELSAVLEPQMAQAIKRLTDVEKIKMGCRLTGSIDLSSSNLGEWKTSHKKLVSMLFYNKTVFNSQFASFYPATKILPSVCFDFEYLSDKTITPQVCPEGNSLGSFIKDNNLADWFCAKYIRLIFENLNINNTDATAIILFFEEESRKMIEENIIPSFAKIEELAGSQEKIKKALGQYNVMSLFDHWIVNGSKAQEKDAYLVVAQHLFQTRATIWSDFHLGNMNPECIIGKINSGQKTHNNSYFEDRSISRIIKKMISAVACSYVIGHFKTGDESICFDLFDKNLGKISAYDYIVRSNMPVLFATARPPDKYSSENLRLNNIEDYALLSKNLDNGQYSGICMNMHNLILNLVDIEKDVDKMDGGAGKYIKEVVVDLINNQGIGQQSYRIYSIYSILYCLKQKGMDFGYLSFSIDSGNLGTSIALREIKKHLMKNTNPKDLPPSFYGIDENLEALHLRAIREHTYRVLDRV
ncbi:MAG: hypothetical protein KAR87_02050 [Candidatus Aenigmarchaeota archaeon]|nr:hypothetical protein [Candidatus Aenigmarchaeota archaeon]